VQATQRTHQVVLYYIRLLTSLPVSDLMRVLPRLPKLIDTCQVGPECAMAVYRPILRTLYKLNSGDSKAEGDLKGVLQCTCCQLCDRGSGLTGFMSSPSLLLQTRTSRWIFWWGT
jgi:hypothetical protein